MTHRLVENPPLPGKGDDGLDQSLRIRVTNDFDPNDAAFETGISVRAFSDGVIQAARVAMTKGRGTSSSPQPVEELDFIGEVRFSGYYGDTHDDVATGALIQGQASEDWTPTNRGMDIVFWTITPATAILEERIRINTDGMILTGDFIVTGGLTFSSLALNGAISIAGTLDVTGDLTIGGDFLFDDNLAIAGPRPWIDVTHPTYGADPTGVANSTVAIQAAIDAGRALPTGAIIVFPGGDYLVDQLDGTDIAHMTFEGAGMQVTRLIPNSATNSILDLTGAAHVTIRDMQIGDEAQIVAPNCAILLGQVPSVAANQITMERLYITGQYAVATIYNYGVASSTMADCQVFNLVGGTGPVLYWTQSNLASMASDFTAIAAGAQPASSWVFKNVEVHDQTALANNQSIYQAMLCDGAQVIQHVGGSLNSSSDQGIVTFEGSNSHTFLYQAVVFQSDTPGATESNVFKILDASAVSGIGVIHCDFPIPGVDTRAAIFGAVNGATYVYPSFIGYIRGTTTNFFDVDSGNLTALDVFADANGLPSNFGGAGINRGVILNTGAITAAANTALLQRTDGKMSFGGPGQSTVGIAGPADALPATPSRYMRVQFEGSEYVVPLYLQA